MIAKTGPHRGSIQLAVQREFLRKAVAVTDCAAATSGSHSHEFPQRMSYL
jgi:hypothetical protein